MRSCAIGVLEMLESRMLLSVTRIAAISDIGDNNTTNNGEEKVAQMIARWDAPGSALDAIISSGDNYQGSTAPGDNTYYEWLGRWGYQTFVDDERFYPSPGNHDWIGEAAGATWTSTGRTSTTSRIRRGTHTTNPEIAGLDSATLILAACRTLPQNVAFTRKSRVILIAGNDGFMRPHRTWSH